MATKAERFRSEQERSGPKRPKDTLKKTKHKRRMETSAEAEREKSRTGMATPHNFHAGEKTKKGKTYDYEVSEPGKRPSRTSTRTSEAHVKGGTPLTRRQQNRIATPKARAGRQVSVKGKSRSAKAK